MLREVEVERDRQDGYKEPDGEIVEVLEVNPNTLMLLMKEERVPPLLFNPEGFTVAELSDKVAEVDPDEATRRHLIEAEQDGKNRATAIEAIKNVR
jgi:hypothetical protein